MTGKLSIHVNGCFELSSNRRDLWGGEDMEGVGHKKGKWNLLLLEDVIAPAFAQLLEQLTQEISIESLKDYYELWPDLDHLVSPWRYGTPIPKSS